ncbi:helix-turn-helix domain-containing protein [Candidatus Microgenomates bacterium]|nr:helix-turn-helix domain-containing protein [Candidatus Microgenomates bacterium]
MKNDAVLTRLHSSFYDIPTSFWNEKNDNLEKFGITVAGKIFSPLFEKYVKVEQLEPNSFTPNTWNMVFTLKEIEVMKLLKNNTNKIVSRDNVAEKIWPEKIEEKYSDWAIDQTIHRIRQKIKTSKLPYLLKAKKNLGFILIFK